MTNKVCSSWLGDYYSLAFARLRNDWCFVQAALPETLGDCHALRCKARNDGWSLWWVKAPTVVALFSG